MTTREHHPYVSQTTFVHDDDDDNEEWENNDNDYDDGDGDGNEIETNPHNYARYCHCMQSQSVSLDCLALTHLVGLVGLPFTEHFAWFFFSTSVFHIQLALISGSFCSIQIAILLTREVKQFFDVSTDLSRERTRSLTCSPFVMFYVYTEPESISTKTREGFILFVAYFRALSSSLFYYPK